jgi:hypothetical protein
MVMNSKLTELALQIGGSHYLEVSAQYMKATVRRVIDRIVEPLAPDRAASLREVYLRRFDLE